MNNIKNKHPKLIKTKRILFACTLIILTIFWLPAYTQPETQTETITNKADSLINYLTPMEYAFMMHEETSWLFKANVTLEDGYKGRNYFKVGVEKRVIPSFTLNLGIDQSAYETQEVTLNRFGIQSSLEARWYYRLNKRIKNNKVARNMSDNYIALGFGYTHLFREKENNFVSLYAKWGLQRRFLKHGHADIGIKAGVGYTLNKNYSPFLVFNTFVDLGLAFTKDRYKLDHEKLCPVLKCYEADKFIIKSNLSSLFSVSLFKYHKLIDIAPHIAFERKIGSSAFSINTELQAVFSYSENYSESNNKYYVSTDWRVRLLLEGRWYYNLKRRVLKGKTGNGLSSNYIALGGSYSYNKPYLCRSGSFKHNVYIITGWQRLFSKHLYFDISVGFEYYQSDAKKYEGDISPRIRLAVGYRF